MRQKKQDVMSKKRKSFKDWMYEQRDRTDGIGSLARDVFGPHSHLMWVYRLLGFRSAEELRMQIIRAFVEYKTGAASKGQTAPRDRLTDPHREERRPLL